MNCPRCGKEMVVQGDKAVCGQCKISTAVTAAPAPAAAPAPEPKPEPVPETKEVDPDDIEEEAAAAEGFPEEEVQESEEADKE